MKTVKFIGMIVLSLFLSLNFASCSKEDVDSSEIVGEWFLKSDVGYEINKSTGDKDEWNEVESEYTEKVVIKKVEGNIYQGESFTKNNGEWKSDGAVKFKLEGNKLIPQSVDDSEEMTIKTLTSDKMVLVFSYEDDEYKIYNEITYVR